MEKDTGIEEEFEMREQNILSFVQISQNGRKRLQAHGGWGSGDRLRPQWAGNVKVNECGVG
jgi:hypothetical protein